MKPYTLSKMTISRGKKLGYMIFLADSEEDAVRKALYTARLTNGSAFMGITGKVVYPSGALGDEAWVLVRKDDDEKSKEARVGGEPGLP